MMMEVMQKVKRFIGVMRLAMSELFMHSLYSSVFIHPSFSIKKNIFNVGMVIPLHTQHLMFYNTLDIGFGK